jgi:thioredoxin 1
MLKYVVAVVAFFSTIGIGAGVKYMAMGGQSNSAIVQVTDSSFDREVHGAKGLVLVTFWADWCGACRATTPVLDEVHAEMGHKVKFVKVDVDQSRKPSAQYKVTSLPSLLLFKDGKLIDTKLGHMPKEEMKNWINSNS